MVTLSFNTTCDLSIMPVLRKCCHKHLKISTQELFSEKKETGQVGPVSLIRHERKKTVGNNVSVQLITKYIFWSYLFYVRRHFTIDKIDLY